jgi:hypothetical protein
VLKAADHRVRRRDGLRSGDGARGWGAGVARPGPASPEIAAGLQVSRKTMSSDVEHIYAKAGVKTRTEAALFAVRHGLIGMADEPEA